MRAAFASVRADFRHFCDVHGACGFWGRLWVLCISRSLWGLALYRIARGIYALPRSPTTLPLRAWYAVTVEIVRRLAKVSLDARAEIGERVWLAPQGAVFCTQGGRIGSGSMLFGGNTLGMGGRTGARGKPQLGEDAVLCPGAAAIGPVHIPPGTVIGSNSLVGRTMPAGKWAGVPAKPCAAVFVPAPRTLGGHREESDMQPEPFWPAWRADLERHFIYHPDISTLKKLRLALTLDGSWSMAHYRFGRRLKTMPPPQPFGALGWAVYRFFEIVLGWLTSVYLDVDARIEPGFYVGHFVQVHVGAGVRIGRHSSISQMCTVAGTGPDPSATAPVLGERVYLGSGAKVIGPFKVGDGAAIGASSVVVADVPENGVVIGNPGVVVSKRGSKDFIYLGAEGEVRDEIAPPEPQRKAV
jgi:serine O-acetyltransferase